MRLGRRRLRHVGKGLPRHGMGSDHAGLPPLPLAGARRPSSATVCPRWPPAVLVVPPGPLAAFAASCDGTPAGDAPLTNEEVVWQRASRFLGGRREETVAIALNIGENA